MDSFANNTKDVRLKVIRFLQTTYDQMIIRTREFVSSLKFIIET